MPAHMCAHTCKQAYVHTCMRGGRSLSGAWNQCPTSQHSFRSLDVCFSVSGYSLLLPPRKLGWAFPQASSYLYFAALAFPAFSAPHPYSAFRKHCEICQDLTIKPWMTHAATPAWSSLFQAIGGVAWWHHCSHTMTTTHSLLTVTATGWSEVGPTVNLLIQMRKLMLCNFRPGSTQAITPKFKPKSSRLTSSRISQFCFLNNETTVFLRGWRVDVTSFTFCICKACEKHIVRRVNIVFQNARCMRGAICCSEVVCSCHMPPYCCFGCYHGKSTYRPRKEPILKPK